MIPSKPRTESEILLVQIPEEIHLYPEYSDFIPDVVIVVGFHMRIQPLKRCLNSIVNQDVQQLKVLVVIGNDSKTDILDLIENFQERLNITVLNILAGKAAQSRNMLLDYVDRRYNRPVWIARLDADDELAASDALVRMVDQGEINQAKYVIGGNLLRANDKIIGENRAEASLKNTSELLKQLKKMGEGTAKNELPSCNLLLRSHANIRYPHHHSAEDHWLLTELLIFKKEQGHIAEDIIYAIYELGGNTTNVNQFSDRYFCSREKLFQTASQWIVAINSGQKLLGYGNEGIVYEDKGNVIKEFYDGAFNVETASWLNSIETSGTVFPKFKMYQEDNRWFCKYKMNRTQPFISVSVEKLEIFLLSCLRSDLAPLNIKRDNLRITESGNIQYIDIGKDIKQLTASSFLDISARLYAIGILNMPDSYIFRYPSTESQHEALERLPEFRDFYKNLILSYSEGLIGDLPVKNKLIKDEVTLVIKCCAMDADFVEEQIPHIIHGLEKPLHFYKKIILIDSFEGPFLRAYAEGDLKKVLEICEKYKSIGLIDDVWLFPLSNELNLKINESWFDCRSNQSHTVKQAPVTSQLWAFERIETRYVLQCDVDVLIGRRDYSDDYINEMLSALRQDEKAFSCGFNIPKDPTGGFESYAAPNGAFVPEVRLGLLDLQRIKNHRPFPNTINNGRLNLSWFRSIEQFQKQHEWKSLRGGSPLTFYIHPPNHFKKDQRFIRLVRQLCEMGQVPESQFLKWDLEDQRDNWVLPKRNEEIVFLIKGRNISLGKITRCLTSLKLQDDQCFGMIIIDDCSNDGISRHYPSMLGSLQSKTSLIKREIRVGRIPNFITGIKKVCQNPESLIVILDMDDALIHHKTVSFLKQQLRAGHDLIQGGVFRPDKPLKQYQPKYSANVRKEYGNDTWSHLRSFKKKLFDAIPETYFKMNKQWIRECTDYATMIPLTELAKSPVFLDQYLYLHERSTTNPDKMRKAEIIQFVVNKEPLC